MRARAIAEAQTIADTTMVRSNHCGPNFRSHSKFKRNNNGTSRNPAIHTNTHAHEAFGVAWEGLIGRFSQSPYQVNVQIVRNSRCSVSRVSWIRKRDRSDIGKTGNGRNAPSSLYRTCPVFLTRPRPRPWPAARCRTLPRARGRCWPAPGSPPPRWRPPVPTPCWRPAASRGPGEA